MSSLPSQSDHSNRIYESGYFKEFDQVIQKIFVDGFEQVTLVAGETLYHAGDLSDDGMYILLEGQVQEFISEAETEQVINEFGAGTILGEVALLTGVPRRTSLSAVIDTTLARMPKTTFDKIMDKYPYLLPTVSRLALQRLHRPQLLEVLNKFFGSLDLTAINDVEKMTEWVHLSRGSMLIEQGDTDDNLYFLIDGRLQAVARDEQGNEEVVGTIFPGESVGEMHIITGEARSVSVYAARDSELVQISSDNFDKLVNRYPQMMKHIAQIIIKRHQKTMNTVKDNRLKLADNFVLAPVNADVPIEEFSESFISALQTLGSVLYLNSERFDALFQQEGIAEMPEDDPQNNRVLVWLNEQEKLYDFIVYETKSTITSWTKRCLRQANQILLVADADHEATISAFEIELTQFCTEQRGIQQDLILLHAADKQQPINTKQWLDQRDIAMHYHVRQENDKDFRRVARFTSGRAVSLVCGGGGIRGFVHLGVIRALEELGIEIDMVAGASFGSIIGAAFAQDWDYDRILESSRKLLSDKRVFDYTLPITSLFDCKHMNHLLMDLFGDIQIEDSWRPYFCVTVDLHTYEEYYHQHGSLWKFVRASIAVPPFFSPVMDEGRILIDGGIINNLPVDAVRQLSNSKTVIAVDPSIPRNLDSDFNFEPSLSGWEILWSRINPFRQEIKSPTILSLLGRWAGAMSTLHRIKQSALADIYIHPPSLEKYGMFTVDAYQELIEIGYNMGREELMKWQNEEQADAETN